MVVLLQGEIAAGVSYDALVQESVQICVSQVGMTETFCQGYVPQVAVSD